MEQTTADHTVPLDDLGTPNFGRERHSPGAYRLDLSAVRHLWTVVVKMNGEASTFGDVYRKLRDSKVEKMPELLEQRYVTEAGDILLDCPWPIAATMHTLIDLNRQEIDLFGVTWFYYDYDWSRDADVSHRFFAIFKGKIVSESIHFGSNEPMILKRHVDDDPIWHSHRYFDEASEHYWYRKFYSETMTGQLMVLRPDEPMLYYFERPQSHTYLVRDAQFLTITKLHKQLWVAVALVAAAAFPAYANILGVIAAISFIELIWFGWRVRRLSSNGRSGTRSL